MQWCDRCANMRDNMYFIGDNSIYCDPCVDAVRREDHEVHYNVWGQDDSDVDDDNDNQHCWKCHTSLWSLKHRDECPAEHERRRPGRLCAGYECPICPDPVSKEADEEEDKEAEVTDKETEK